MRRTIISSRKEDGTHIQKIKQFSKSSEVPHLFILTEFFNQTIFLHNEEGK
jgi:hypothetical protein